VTSPTSDIAFTSSVKEIQQRLGSRENYARMEQGPGWNDRITPDLIEFLSELDTFFLGTSNADGQPYIQHRGGPPGFLKALDDKTLGFADFRGNRQYITVGNLEDNNKAFIFLIDFAQQRRIKIWGHARVVEDDPEILEKLRDRSYRALLERAIVFTVDAWDINCPQHIKQRYTVEEFAVLQGQT
jgi:predicted pyridoxine 5'-phosphate oxidase superfamily flavin-nucleotide-binding protein